MTKHFPENKKPLGYVYKEDHNPREPNIGALRALKMQTATFAKRRHYAVPVRGIHPEALSIVDINGRESLKSRICEMYR